MAQRDALATTLTPLEEAVLLAAEEAQ